MIKTDGNVNKSIFAVASIRCDCMVSLFMIIQRVKSGSGTMSTATYSSPKIAKAFSKQFGKDVKAAKVEMKYQNEIGSFIKKVENAQRLTVNSQTTFK